MTEFSVEQLKQLPQRASETWQGGFIRMPVWVPVGPGEFSRPVTVFWGSLQTGKVGMGDGGGHMANRDELSKEARFAKAVDELVKFATGQHGGYRPGKLEVNDPALAEHLSGLLAEANIRVEHRSRLLMVERCKEVMARGVSEKGKPIPPGYLRGKGVTVERVRAFAEAARLYFEAAPWRLLSREDLIEVESPRAEADFRFVAILSGGEYRDGFGFYRSREHYWSTRGSVEEQMKFLAGGVWSLLFQNITMLPFDDADLWEDNALPVAGEWAYPVVFHFETPTRLRRPSAETLAFFEGLMRTLAQTTEAEMDTGRWTRTVTTADGPKEFVLSLPFLANPPSHSELYDHGIVDHRASELLYVQMNRFVEDKEFVDADEANKAVEEEFRGKPIDPNKYPPRTPLEEAQTLCFRAFDSIGRRRIILARQALQICPDCADAYVILAENAYESPRQAEELYTAGVEAGRRALGEQFFEEHIGDFWDRPNTRPFMRALYSLAGTQRITEKFTEAVKNFQELLRLNPADNQGARYALLPLLIAQNQIEQAEKLLADFPDDAMATWRFCRALLIFRKEGDTPAARKQLQQAVTANRHVPACLLGDDDSADYGEPTGYSLGSPQEAIACTIESLHAWQATPNALDWLRAQTTKA